MKKYFTITSPSWEGTVALLEDSSFEGIVTDKGADVEEEHLVTGVLSDVGAVLMQFSKPGVLPCSFSGHSVGERVIGNWCSHDLCSENEKGTGVIIFAETTLEGKKKGDLDQRCKRFKRAMSRISVKMYKEYVKCMNDRMKELFYKISRNNESIEKRLVDFK